MSKFTQHTELRARRLRLGLTIMDVAHRAGVSQSSVERFENGVLPKRQSDALEAVVELFDQLEAERAKAAA